MFSFDLYSLFEPIRPYKAYHEHNTLTPLVPYHLGRDKAIQSEYGH
jgi:hypothetical protein